MCLCQWCVVSNCFLIVFRDCNGETVGVDGAAGTVCLAGLVGVVRGYFGGVVVVLGCGLITSLNVVSFVVVERCCLSVRLFDSILGHHPLKNQVFRLSF